MHRLFTERNCSWNRQSIACEPIRTTTFLLCHVTIPTNQMFPFCPLVRSLSRFLAVCLTVYSRFNRSSSQVISVKLMIVLKIVNNIYYVLFMFIDTLSVIVFCERHHKIALCVH